ncbi:acyl-CoA dehydrogenase family protein [Myxococcota bacterium]|nr:acyl-CoA dehydrogenase family protein [Myxococcota bacterium]
MDFSFGSEYEAFRETVRVFLGENWPLRGEEADLSESERARRFRRRATEAGYLYRNIPRRFGGSEQPPDLLEAQILREEFGRARAPMELTGQGPQMVVPTLLEWGTEWQQERFIPKTVEGDYVWCQGYSEPGAGSDLASLQTRGERVGDEWVIHGQKIWTTHWNRAQYMFALVRTEPDASKHEGISYLLLEMDQPGIDVRPLKQITGASEFAEVFFDGARTPADWIVGERGQGWRVSRSLLKHERNMLGSGARAQGLFRSLIRLATRVERQGHKAVDDPMVAEKLVELMGYVRSQQYSSYIQLTRELQGGESGLLPLLNKIGNSNIAQQISSIALSLLGSDSLLAPGANPRGTTSGNEKWMNQFMGSLGESIAGGTSNIQRNIIAERGLGLPRQESPASKDEAGGER